MTHTSVVTATSSDIPVIQSLVQRTWKPTYGAILSDAQMDYMLDMMYATGVLEQQFAAGHHFLLLLEDGQPAGFAGYELDCGSRGTCKLHKIYLLPETQGKSMGKRLFGEVKKRAEAAGQSRLILNVNRYNKALDFYRRLGMQIESEVDVPIGNGYYMNDYILRLELGEPHG